MSLSLPLLSSLWSVPHFVKLSIPDDFAAKCGFGSRLMICFTKSCRGIDDWFKIVFLPDFLKTGSSHIPQ